MTLPARHQFGLVTQAPLRTATGSRPRLHRFQTQHVISAAEPCVLVGSPQEGFSFGPIEDSNSHFGVRD